MKIICFRFNIAFIVLLITVFLCLSCTKRISLEQYSESNKFVDIKTLIHLGDKKPTWIHAFWIEKIPINPVVVIECSEVAGSKWGYRNVILINEKKVDSLNWHFHSQNEHKKKVILRVKSSFFKIGKNKIQINSSKNKENFDFDDFNIHSLTLYADNRVKINQVKLTENVPKATARIDVDISGQEELLGGFENPQDFLFKGGFDNPQDFLFKERNLADQDTKTSDESVFLESGSKGSVFLAGTSLPKARISENNSDAVAVIIGNQNYSHIDIPSVSYASNDASAVKKYLIDSLGYKDGNIIFEMDISKSGFEKIFGTDKNYRGMLYNYIKPDKSDVFIYYSGHGSPDPNTNKAYLVPTDCDPVMMDLTAYPLDVLYGNLPKIEAKSITVVVDACFSGGTNTGKWLVPNASPALIKINNPVTAQNNVTIFTSAKNNQVSSWYPEKQHSMFTYFFLAAVTGSADFNQDNQITYQEIYDFVADRAEGVPYYAKRLHGGRIQNPTMNAANVDAVFVKF